MNRFVNAVQDEAQFNSTMKLTENGAVARSTTGYELLDFYATVGAMRSRAKEDIEAAFDKAWKCDPLYALKILFWVRDIRGEGQGERRTFRIILRHLAFKAPSAVTKNLPNVLEMGRADDLYCLVGTPVEKDMWAYLRKVVLNDINNYKAKKPISLTAKWLKSINTSSKESRALGVKTAKALGLTPREYRKLLSTLRAYLKVVEVDMSKNKWDSIDYSAVPSRAMNIYRKAFERHTPGLFDTYIEKVKSGEEKINSSTLYPYDLVEKYGDVLKYWGYRKSVNILDSVVEAQWKALPNYVDGENNVLVMADVSGSMSGRPMYTSVGLAIYFAERNKGSFKNLYMTFTSDPHYLTVNPNDTLLENVAKVGRTGVGYSTNLQAAFDKVLSTCVENNVPQSEVPKALVVVSDMEIDRYMRGYGLDFVSTMARKWADNGYTMPQLILWNVEARNDTFHANYKNPYVQFVSGQSASAFKSVINSIGMTAVDAMFKVLNNERYASVVL